MIYFELYQLVVQIFYVLSVVCFKESFSIEGKYTKNLSNYKIVYPVKVTGPDDSSRRNRRWQDSDQSTVHYQLKLGGNEELIDLEPNYHILSTGAIMERRTSTKIDNEPLANVQLEKPSFTQCFFKGKVRNYEDSSTALSTCGGLCGYIRVKRHTYFIEPVERLEDVGQNQPHVLYEDKQTEINAYNCATKLADDYKHDDPLIGKNVSKIMYPEKEANSIKPTPNKRLHIETLLVLDQSMMDLHDANDLQNYALTVFNMAQSLFHDLSTDPPIDLEIVRIIEVEDPKEIINFRQSRHLGNVEMDTFSTWQLRINPKDENHPNHHDLAILLTGNDICDEENSCHYVGLAETNGACRPKRQAAICKDNGLMLGYIIAHQIAHTLGVGHDPPDKTPDGTSSVMSPTITLSPKVWSEQSRSALMSAIKKRQLTCLEDEPGSEFKVTDMLPGVMYDADYQCQQLLTSDARSCSTKGDCQSLACEFDGTSCTNTGIMPAPGTSCGSNKWCFDGACLDTGKRPLAVHGNWGSWSEWSQCSRTCGAGVSVSTRECNSPLPMHGGKSCSGRRNRHKICTTEPCEVDSRPFRDVQCAEYNDWVFPEDGKLHKWKGYFISNGNPCALYCRNENDVVVSLSPKVKDGTTCYRGLRDICVEGICRDIPCDLQFDSDSVEDACGICHGNGTACKVVQGQTNVKKGTSQILSIPAGTRNIVVEEINYTPSHLTLKFPEKDDIINEGKKLGMFNASGSMGWLGMKKPNQEILEIPGPLVKPVEIWISSEGPQSIAYSMGLQSEPREGKYSWDYLDWSACMAQCGDSYQDAVPKCVEQLSGHVEDKYCSQVVKPPIKRRSCNAGICLPRWLVGEWQECGPCPSKDARRFRIVRCIKPTAGSEEGMMIISDKVCPGPRPMGSEHCRCIKRQILYWPSPYRFDMLSNDFKILSKTKKENKTSKMPEKKVTLMQLENENEESMLKQFKENQQKHHSIFYMPNVLGSRFNFSIPFKKREAVINEMPDQESLPRFNDNFIKYLPKPDVLDLIRTGNRIMGNNYLQTTQSVKIFSLNGLRDKFNSINVGKLRPIATNDPPPLHFSDQNILKLLSDNLPLDRLKQQRNMNHNSRNPFRDVLYFPDILLNDTSFGQSREDKKLDIIEILMNEFNNVLATNALIQPNTKSNPTSIIPPVQSIPNKPSDTVFKNRIQVSREPFFFTNTSGIDAAISQLQKSKPTNEIMNVSNGFMNLKGNNLGLNNQRVTENWIPSADLDWNNSRSDFRKYFLNMQSKPQVKTGSKTINDQLSKIDETFFLISTRPTTTNVTNDYFNPVKFLTRKVTEKLNSLNDIDKLKAYQLLTVLVNNLHNTLSAFPQQQHSVNEVILDDNIPSTEIQLMPMRGDSFETEINKEKPYDFNPKNQDELSFNQNKNSVFNYSLPNFDRPIFSTEDLIKIKNIFQSGDNAVSDIDQNEKTEFYQLKKKKKKQVLPTSKKKDKTTLQITKIPECSTVSISNHLDEFIEKYLSDLHKSERGRIKKEVQKLISLDKSRIERFIEACSKRVTAVRRITGVYDVPLDRKCPTTTTTIRPRYFLQRCRKNIADTSSDKNNQIVDNNPLEVGNLFIPESIKTIKVLGRKKRFRTCEESTRICEELKRRFKDRLANVTKLDPYQCQRLREEILHVKHNLMSEDRLQEDLGKVVNDNTSCIFLYGDEKETTTPFDIN